MSSKFKQFINQHYLAIILAVIVGFLMILPQIIFMIQTGDDYAGINILATDSEIHYLARFQEIDEGDWGWDTVFLTFNKKEAYQRPHFGQVLMYSFGQLFFLSPVQINLLTKFILPAILFLLIYFFVLSFTKDKRIALSAPAGVMLWHGISSLSEIKNFLANNLVIPKPSIFSRPVIPILGIIFLFAFFYVFYLYIRQGKKIYPWLAGIFLGFSLYIYFFTWSFLIVFIGVAGLWFLFKKDWHNFKKILKVIFLALLINLPYLFNLYKFINLKSFSSVTNQVGLKISNSPIIGVYLILAWVLYFLGWRSKIIKGKNLWFWFCLNVSFVIILNQQIITQRIIQPGHYHWYVIKPLVIVLLIWFVFNFIKNKCKACAWALFLILIAGGFYLLITQQIFTYAQSKDDVLVHSQAYAPVYQWLNQNTDKNQIILSPARDVAQYHLMSCYTHLDEYSFRNKVLFPYSYEQNKHILFLEYRLNKITPNMAQELFPTKLREELFYKIYDYYFYKTAYLESGKSTDEAVEEILAEYIDFYQKDLELQFKKYPIDYLLWDQELNPDWDLDKLDFLKLIFQANGVKIYKFL